MDKIRFLTFKEIVRMHKGQVTKSGGSVGIRDENLLDSAINMPKAMFSNVYLHKDVFEMAAALIRNDVLESYAEDNLYKLAMNIATSKITKKEAAEFFRSKCIKQ